MFMDVETYSDYYYYMLMDRDTAEADMQEYSDLFAESADMLDWYVERQTVQLNGYDAEYAAVAMTDTGYSMVQGEAYVVLNEQFVLVVSVVSMTSTPMTQEELLAAMETAFRLDLPIS